MFAFVRADRRNGKRKIWGNRTDCLIGSRGRLWRTTITKFFVLFCIQHESEEWKLDIFVDAIDFILSQRLQFPEKTFLCCVNFDNNPPESPLTHSQFHATETLNFFLTSLFTKDKTLQGKDSNHDIASQQQALGLEFPTSGSPATYKVATFKHSRSAI